MVAPESTKCRGATAPVQDRLGLLVRLCHHRWAIPILAELHHGGDGAKFVTLTFRLGVSKSALSATLAHLIDLGWVTRNPGYGHPMRPEYILTRAGKRLAPWCARVHTLLKRTRTEDALLRKWSLPIAFAMHRGATRFAELRDSLPTITSRALALALKDLQRAEITVRRVEDDCPIRIEYRLAQSGRRVAAALASLRR
jgi:DNA-binding HxlR family transcriptional regulator